MNLELNEALQPEGLAADYAIKKRLQVRDFLSAQSADVVLRDLLDLPWGTAFNEGAKVHQLHAHVLADLTADETARIIAGIHSRARTQYQFLYSFYPILTAYFSPAVKRHGIFKFFEFINSEPVLDAVRTITGLPQIRWADGQATWFKPGHFLKMHSDENAGEQRVAAYVMNMSPTWERDWGGFLQFFDEEDNIEAAFKPSFNTLNLFTVPQLHSVSMVSTYVTEKRLAVTGWFRTDDPPSPIGDRS